MNTGNRKQKEYWDGKVNSIPERFSDYIQYVKKGIAKIIDFKPFEDVNNDRSAFDIFYLIGLGSELEVMDGDERAINDHILTNITKGFIKEGYSIEDAENSAKIIAKYVGNFKIIDQLINEKSVLLLGQKGYIKNMNAIYRNFFDNKEDLLENGINYAPKGKEGCYVVVYQYDKEFSDKISDISRRIGEFIRRKKEEGVIDKDCDFIEYSSDNIHTSLLTTQTTQNFSVDDSNITAINNSLDKIIISPFKLNVKGIKINRNSLIVANDPQNAIFLENIKKSLSSAPSLLNLGGARGSHITIGRFIGEIKNKKVLEELYEMIDRCSKDLPSEISPEKIVVGYINMETKYNEGSYFKIFPKHSVCFEED